MAERETYLARYLGELWRWMADERRDTLEAGWNAAYDAYRGRYNSEYLEKWRRNEGTSWRSTVFVRLTKIKVRTGYDQVMSILMQAGKLPWDLKARHEPEEELAREALDERVERMRASIESDLDACRADRVLAESVFDLALYGASWLRCPVMRPRGRVAVKYEIPGFQFVQTPELLAQYGRAVLVREEMKTPVVEHPSLWDVFWDLEVGDPTTEGNGIFVRREMTAGRFAALRDLPGYDKEAIDRVLQSAGRAASRASDDTSKRPVLRELSERRAVVPVYEFHGLVPRGAMKGRDDWDAAGADRREVEISCVVAGEDCEEVIRRPIENDMPYRPLYLCQWEAMPNETMTEGIAGNVRDSQGIVNGLARAFLDAKALAANPMMGIKAEKLAPGQGRVSYPGKIWEVAETAQNVNEAIQGLTFPDVTPGILEALQVWQTFADEESGLPKMLSGEVGLRQPDTAFEMAQYVESANRGIGSVIRNIDERHIEPLVTALYHWHMMTDADEGKKGDFLVKATGFSSYQDKLRRGTNLMGLWQLAMGNPLSAPYVKVGDMLRDIARTRDVDPERVFYSDEELQARAAEAAAMQGPPALPGGMPGADMGGGGGVPGAPPEVMGDASAARAEEAALAGGPEMMPGGGGGVL